MDIVIFFGFLFFSSILAFFYFMKDIIYLGVLSSVIIIFIGIILAANGSIEQSFCFSEIDSEVLDTINNITDYTYVTTCHTETLNLSRDFLNALGLTMMFIGGGMVVSFGYDVWKKEGYR